MVSQLDLGEEEDEQVDEGEIVVEVDESNN